MEIQNFKKTKGNPKLLDKKREAYKSDIIFATAPTIAFDYLEDNHALNAEKRFMKKDLFLNLKRVL